MARYVFSFKDDQIQLALVSKRGRRIAVVANETILDWQVNRNFNSGLISSNDELMSTTRQFITDTKNKSKKIDFIIALDSIITRTIELPYLNEKNLKDYIKNNISTYFTVDMDMFFYDYRILEVTKASKDVKKVLTIMIVVVPSSIVYGIKKFADELKLKVGKINIYPDLMLNFSDPNKNMAVLDIGSSKCLITIFEQGKTFVFTSIPHHLNEDEGFDDLMDEIEYFTNFFASRHQGSKLDSLFAIGKHADDLVFIEKLKARLGIPIDEINRAKWDKIASLEQLEVHADMIVSQIKNKQIFDKYIDFSNEEKLKTAVKREFKPSHMLLILIAITAAWFVPFWVSLEQEEARYSTVAPQSNDLTELQVKLDSLNKERQTLQDQESAITSIYENQTDYMEIVNQLKTAVPNTVKINKLEIDHKNVAVDFKINFNTVDALELVIAINRLNFFEPVDIEELQLDDTTDSLTLELLVR